MFFLRIHALFFVHNWYRFFYDFVAHFTCCMVAIFLRLSVGARASLMLFCRRTAAVIECVNLLGVYTFLLNVMFGWR